MMEMPNLNQQSPLNSVSPQQKTGIPPSNLHDSQLTSYQSKGYGLFVALLLVFAFFSIVPNVLKLIWSLFLNNFSREVTFFTLAICFHTGGLVIANSIMYLIYKLKHPFFERYKISNKPWPWESNPDAFYRQLQKTIKSLLFSHFVIVPIILCIEIKSGMEMRMDIESFPTVDEIILQLLFFTVVEDFFFYWTHRLLHHPKFYPYVHKVHHEYHIVISLAAEYAHPVEFLLSNVLPYNVGPKLLGSRVHFATYLIWIGLAQMETADQHCGYGFSWSPFRLIPFCGSAPYHDFHHSHNVGNYTSLFTLWDSICGTNKAYNIYLAKKKMKMLENMLKKEQTIESGQEKKQN